MSIEIRNDLQQIAAGPEPFAGDVTFVREDWLEKVCAGEKLLFGSPFKGGGSPGGAVAPGTPFDRAGHAKVHNKEFATKICCQKKGGRWNQTKAGWFVITDGTVQENINGE